MLQCKTLRTYYDAALNKLALLLVYSRGVQSQWWNPHHSPYQDVSSVLGQWSAPTGPQGCQHHPLVQKQGWSLILRQPPRDQPPQHCRQDTGPYHAEPDHQAHTGWCCVWESVWLQKAEGHGGYGLCYQAAPGKMCRAAPSPPPALHRSHQGIRHSEPSCTLGDTQQARMPTSFCTDHPLLPWWHVLQGHRKWWRLGPISSVKWSEARLRACPNTVQSPLCSDAFCSSLPNWGRSQNPLPHWWRCLQPPPTEVIHQSDSGHCARLPLCIWLRTCSSLRGRLTGAGCLFRHCSKVIRANSEHQENWSVETARPKHCSAPTQHHHGWKCAEKCRHFQIPRQLHKLCSQPWWWGSVPHLTSKPGIWAPPHTSMAWAGHLDQDQAERIPSCCATVSPVRLRDLDLLQAAYQETGPVSPALPSQSSPCQLEGPCAKPGDPSQGWAHWHWSHVKPGTASLVRTCHSHGWQQTSKTTVPCWALNWKTAQRWAEEAVQRCAEIYPQGLQHPSWQVASLGPGPAGLEGSYSQGHKPLWEKPSTEPGWKEISKEEQSAKP